MGKNGYKSTLNIAEEFSRSTFLLTGATGYVGSLVLEQVLRTCPDVLRVLVLVRGKRGVSPQDRLRSLLEHELFHLLTDNQLLKVQLLEGDMLLPGCGIRDECRTQLSQVTHVVHGAASITFTDHIFKSLATNYQAVKEVAALVCEACPALKSFTHISTAYVNSHLPAGSRVPEQLLPAREIDKQFINHSEFVQLLRSLSPAAAQARAAGIFPNNYCLTKWLAEQMLVHDFPQLRLALVRPAIVGSVRSKPIPGFIGNKSGATGAALAIAAGLWRYSHHSPSSIMDIVAGDTVASAVLVSAAAVASPLGAFHNKAAPLIVHVGTSSSSPLTTGSFYQHVRLYFEAHPLPTAARLGKIPEKVFIVRNPLVGAAVEAASEVWWHVAAAWLAISGRMYLAQKMLDAWRAVKTFNQRRMQFDLRFETDELQHLASCLPSNERLALEAFCGDSARCGHKCPTAVSIFATTPPHSRDVLLSAADPEVVRDDPPPDSNEVWTQYMSDYMKGAAALVLKRPLLTRLPRRLPTNH